MSTNPFPLDFVRKENSPDLLAWFQQFGKQGYISAEDANQFYDAIIFLFQNLVIGNSARPTRIITPETASLIDSDYMNNVVLIGDSNTNFVFPTPGTYAVDSEIWITSLCDGNITFTNNGNSFSGLSPIPLGATLIMKQISIGSWVCNFRLLSTGNIVAPNLNSVLLSGGRSLISVASNRNFTATDRGVYLLTEGNITYSFPSSSLCQLGDTFIIDTNGFDVILQTTSANRIKLNGSIINGGTISVPDHVKIILTKITSNTWSLHYLYGTISGGSGSYTLQDITANGYETNDPIISNDAISGKSVTASVDNSYITISPELGGILASMQGLGVLLLDFGNLIGNWTLSFQNKNGTVAYLDDLTSKADLVDGTVPAAQLPAYVDDVIEYNNLAAFPATGETSKIYMAKDTNKTYRWSGSTYVALDEGVALGETSSTAYRGDRGKSAYDHATSSGNPHGTTAADVGAYSSTQVDSLLLSRIKFIAKNTANPTISLTSTETIFESYLVPAGTLSSIDQILMRYRYRKTGTNNISRIRIYINTANSLSGATLIAVSQTAATNLWVLMERTFSISGGNIYGFPFTSSAITDVTGLGVALTSSALNISNNFYIIITGQLDNSSDSMTLDFFRATT